MIKTNFDKWVDLFEKKGSNPERVEILQEIDVGYNSTVYLTSVNGDDYAVKMYNERFNGTNVGVIERNQILRARKYIPGAVPQVYFCSKHTENEFHREILVMEKAVGVPLSKDVFTEQVFEELVNSLKRLHSTDTNSKPESKEIDRLNNCHRVLLQFLSEDEAVVQERVSHHLEALRNYYLENREIFNVPRTITHGDLWWDNILVNNRKVTIVDWLESSEQDYCRELAHLKIGTLNQVLDPNRSQRFFERIVNAYKQDFGDETIVERIRYYLPLMYLEESFYLPFKFFPWEIKYQENADNFRARFLDYFERSEWFFKYEQELSP